MRAVKKQSCENMCGSNVQDYATFEPVDTLSGPHPIFAVFHSGNSAYDDIIVSTDGGTRWALCSNTDQSAALVRVLNGEW